MLAKCGAFVRNVYCLIVKLNGYDIVLVLFRNTLLVIIASQRSNKSIYDKYAEVEQLSNQLVASSRVFIDDRSQTNEMSSRIPIIQIRTVAGMSDGIFTTSSGLETKTCPSQNKKSQSRYARGWRIRPTISSPLIAGKKFYACFPNGIAIRSTRRKETSYCVFIFSISFIKIFSPLFAFQRHFRFHVHIASLINGIDGTVRLSDAQACLHFIIALKADMCEAILTFNTCILRILANFQQRDYIFSFAFIEVAYPICAGAKLKKIPLTISKN